LTIVKSLLTAAAVFGLVCCGAGNLPVRGATWSGGGVDAKWETAANWAESKAPANGDVLVFPSATNTNARNGTSNIALNGITINADAGGYQLNGKPIKLKGDITDNSKESQSINLYITLMKNVTISTSGDLSLGGVIRGEKFGITKTGDGQLALTGACAYTGPTTVHGGSLLLGTANALSPSSTLLLDGAKVYLGQGTSPSVGPLNIASASVMDFGAGSGSHAVTFANSQALAWTGTLAIYNWDGDATATNSLAFGTDNTGLKAAQLKSIVFYRDTGKTRLVTAKWASNNGQLTFTQ
jgi:autotransporter-associated beta strand protein